MKDLDASKMQYLSFRAGYRYNRTIHDNGDPFFERRPIMELTPVFRCLPNCCSAIGTVLICAG